MICKKFKVFILFDYSHAQISSYNNNMNFEEYMNKFQKSKIIQVHFVDFHSIITKSLIAIQNLKKMITLIYYIS